MSHVRNLHATSRYGTFCANIHDFNPRRRIVHQEDSTLSPAQASAGARPSCCSLQKEKRPCQKYLPYQSVCQKFREIKMRVQAHAAEIRDGRSPRVLPQIKCSHYLRCIAIGRHWRCAALSFGGMLRRAQRAQRDKDGSTDDLRWRCLSQRSRLKWTTNV